MSVDVVDFEPSHKREVLDLLARTYGERPPDEIEWWFDGNPVGPRTFLLARDGTTLLGILGASFYRARVRGREQLVALPLWAATDEAARGRGIFQLLNHAIEERARDAGAAIELGFTNRLAGPIYVSKLGWSDVHHLRVWARPLPYGRATSADITRFGREQERAYEALAPRLPGHFVRDARYLNWRFADAPRPYVAFASRGGYAVVGRKRFRGTNVSFVADLVAPTQREARRLLRRCIRAGRGTRALLALVPRAHRAAYVSCGFVPTPQRIRLIGRALAGELPVGPDAWHFSLGDTDYF